MSKAHIPPAVAITGQTTLIGKKEKWTNKGTDKQYVLNILYTVQLVIPDVLTKILGKAVPKKSLMKISIFITLDREIEKRKKLKKKARINLNTLVLFTVIHLVVLIVYTKCEDCRTYSC